MQIICKKAFVFCDTEIAVNPQSNEKMAIVKRKIQINPSVNPQVAPDWIKTDGLYELAIQDGSITEVVVVSKMIDRNEKPEPVNDSGIAKTPSTATTFVADADDATAIEPAQTGWGAQVPTGLNK
jgi:hypothetical protein